MRQKLSLFLPGLVVFTLLLAACSAAGPTSEQTPTATFTPEVLLLAPPGDATAPAIVVEGEAQAAEDEQIITTPTPELTATPGMVDEAVSEIASATGLDRQVILGLTGEDWVNLGISLLITLVGITIITRLIYLLILALSKTTPGKNDEAFLRSIEFQVRLFFGTWIVQYSTGRLLFLSPELKQSLNQIYFSLYVFAVSGVLWKLIDFGLDVARERVIADEEADQPAVFLTLIKRGLRVLLIILAVTIVLNNFGVNITALIAILGIGGLALTLAAQDTLSDMLNGFLILLDRPFRIGDRIHIQELDTWGDVEEIGARTTRIRTRDNRMVIAPNAKIGKSQVVNYTFPDPSVRLQTKVDVAYGTDHHFVNRVIEKALRDIEGIDLEKPIDVLLIDLGASAMKFRVRWWIDSYSNSLFMTDKVHRAIVDALEGAGIEMPFTTYDVNLEMKPGQRDEIRQDEPGDKPGKEL